MGSVLLGFDEMLQRDIKSSNIMLREGTGDGLDGLPYQPILTDLRRWKRNPKTAIRTPLLLLMPSLGWCRFRSITQQTTSSPSPAGATPSLAPSSPEKISMFLDGESLS